MDWLRMVLSFPAGLMLGLFYFGGLWWTVRRLSETRRPGLLFFSSFLLRTLLLMAGMFVVTGGDLGSIVTCLIGILIVRTLMVHRMKMQTI